MTHKRTLHYPVNTGQLSCLLIGSGKGNKGQIDGARSQVASRGMMDWSSGAVNQGLEWLASHLGPNTCRRVTRTGPAVSVSEAGALNSQLCKSHFPFILFVPIS